MSPSERLRRQTVHFPWLTLVNYILEKLCPGADDSHVIVQSAVQHVV